MSDLMLCQSIICRSMNCKSQTERRRLYRTKDETQFEVDTRTGNVVIVAQCIVTIIFRIGRYEGFCIIAVFLVVDIIYSDCSTEIKTIAEVECHIEIESIYTTFFSRKIFGIDITTTLIIIVGIIMHKAIKSSITL